MKKLFLGLAAAIAICVMASCSKNTAQKNGEIALSLQPGDKVEITTGDSTTSYKAVFVAEPADADGYVPKFITLSSDKGMAELTSTPGGKTELEISGEPVAQFKLQK